MTRNIVMNYLWTPQKNKILLIDVPKGKIQVSKLNAQYFLKIKMVNFKLNILINFQNL